MLLMEYKKSRMAFAALALASLTIFLGASYVNNEVRAQDQIDSPVVDPFFELDTENGHTFSFYEVVESDGDSSIAVLEEGLLGNQPILSTAGLSDANALEIFNAVSSPGTQFPEKLTSVLGEDPKLGSQGWLWGQEAIDSSIASANMCNANAFTDQFAGYSSTAQLIRLNERPQDHPGRWKDDPYFVGNKHITLKKYRAQVFDKHVYRTAVAVCNLGYHPYNLGPKIIFRFRNSENKPGVAFQKDVDTLAFYKWHWGPKNQKFDWFTEIKAAHPADKFNIGLAWEFWPVP